MLVTCPCQKCKQPVEFEPERQGEFENCPHCNQSTRLLIPQAAPRGPAKYLGQCEDCHGQISQRALMCPHCGSTAGVRFKLVWDVMCHVGIVGLIFALIAWIFTTIADGVFASLK